MLDILLVPCFFPLRIRFSSSLFTWFLFTEYHNLSGFFWLVYEQNFSWNYQNFQEVVLFLVQNTLMCCHCIIHNPTVPLLAQNMAPTNPLRMESLETVQNFQNWSRSTQKLLFWQKLGNFRTLHYRSTYLPTNIKNTKTVAGTVSNKVVE